MKIDGYKFMPFGIHVGRSGYFLPSFEEETIIKTGMGIDIMFTYSREQIAGFYDKHVAFCHVECEEPSREINIPRSKLVEIYRVIPHIYPIGEIEQWTPLTNYNFYAYVPKKHDPLWLAQLCALSDNDAVKGTKLVVLQFDPEINLGRFTNLFNFRYLRIIQAGESHLRVNIEEIEWGPGTIQEYKTHDT